MTLTFGSLFSGIGGFDRGFDRAGLQCMWQSEIDKDASGVLSRHWPDVPNLGDVRNVGRQSPAVDVICGGFPCQDVSVAGKRAGLAGKRSGLWFEFHRILSELAPQFVVVENVPGLLSSNGGADFAVILRGLVELGYGVAWRILDAQYFGVAQRRRRVFIVGSFGDGRAAEILFERESMSWDSPPRREAGAELARDVAASLKGGSGRRGFPLEWEAGLVARSLNAPQQPRYDGESETFVASVPPTLSAESYSPTKSSSGQQIDWCIFESRFARNGRGAPDTIAPPLKAENGRSGKGDGAPLVAFSSKDDGRDATEELAPTMRVGGQRGGPVNLAIALNTTGYNTGVRRLTPTECERLQGFPDGHTDGQSDSKRYRQLGNAVAVPVAEWLGRQLIAALERAA